MSCNSQASTASVKDRKKEAVSEHAVPMVIKETSMEMVKQLEMEHMPRQVERANLELYERDVNATTREQGNIWKKLEVLHKRDT